MSRSSWRIGSIASTLRPRLFGSISRSDFCCCLFAHFDAVRYSDSVIRITSQMESGDAVQDGLDSLDALFVANGVLRHRIRPARNAVKCRLGLNSQDALQFLPGNLHQCFVAFLQGFATHEAAQQHHIVWHPIVELISDAGTSCNVFALTLRYQEAEALERIIDSVFAIAERQR